MLVKRSTTSPKRRLSNSGRAKFLGKIPFRRGFSFSIRRMALSIVVPTSGVWAALATICQRASCGTKKMLSAVYSSLSSSKPSPSSFSSLYFTSKRSDIYFRKISPSTTDLYSEASRFPRIRSVKISPQQVCRLPYFFLKTNICCIVCLCHYSYCIDLF